MENLNNQLITKENELLENKVERQKYLNNLEILDKVKQLVMLPNLTVANVEIVANYFDIPIKTINNCINDNQQELEQNGLKVLKGKELKDFKGYLDNQESLKYVSQYTILSKRTILNIAMLLRDSEIAKEIRRQLLDFVEDNKEELINQITQEEIYMLKILRAKDNIDKTLAIKEYSDYKERNTKIQVINELKDDIDVAKVLTTGDKGYNFNSFSKALHISKLGRNNLFALLREKEILMSTNEPYQRYLNYFNVKINKIIRNNKEIITTTTFINPKGVKYIFKKLQEWNYLITKTVDEILEELNNNQEE